MNSLQNPVLKPGTYRHYKGGEYEVIGVAKHSETEDQLVVYRPLYGERGLWVRPLAMFNETVEVQGVQVPRFKFLGTSDLGTSDLGTSDLETSK